MKKVALVLFILFEELLPHFCKGCIKTSAGVLRRRELSVFLLS